VLYSETVLPCGYSALTDITTCREKETYFAMIVLSPGCLSHEQEILHPVSFTRQLRGNQLSVALLSYRIGQTWTIDVLAYHDRRHL